MSRRRMFVSNATGTFALFGFNGWSKPSRISSGCWPSRFSGTPSGVDGVTVNERRRGPPTFVSLNSSDGVVPSAVENSNVVARAKPLPRTSRNVVLLR